MVITSYRTTILSGASTGPNSAHLLGRKAFFVDMALTLYLLGFPFPLRLGKLTCTRRLLLGCYSGDGLCFTRDRFYAIVKSTTSLNPNISNSLVSAINHNTWSRCLPSPLFPVPFLYSLVALIFFFKVQVATSAMSTTFVGFSPTKIILPDLVSHCAFPIKVNRHRKQAGAASKKWLFRGDNLTLKKRRAFHGLKAGLLTSMCYPDAGYPQLRVCCDFMNCKCMATRNVRHIYSMDSIRVADLFHLDNLSDDMDTTGTQSTADVVMNSLYHPNTYYSSSRVGRMTKEYAKHFLFDMSMAHL